MRSRSLMSELKPYRRQWSQIVVLQMISSICTVVFAYYLAKVIDRVIFAHMALTEVVPFLAVLLFVVFGRAWTRWVVDVRAYAIAVEVQESFRRRLLAHFCFALGPIGLAGEKSGELGAYLDEGIDGLEGYFAKFLPLCIAAALMPPIILAIVMPSDLFSGLIFLFTAPLIPIFMFLIGKQAEQANRRQWQTLANLSAYFLDLLEGLMLLKIFNQSERQQQEVAAMSEAFRHSTMKVLRVAFLSAFVLELTATLSIAIIAVSVGLRLLAGQVAFEQALFLLLLAPEFYQPLRQLGSAFHQAIAGSIAAAKLYEVLARPAILPGRGGTGRLADKTIAVAFEDVTYAYQADRDHAVHHLSFVAEAGHHTAVVGLSGTGKSTVFQLLMGFAEPQSGQIYLNQQPLLSLAWPSLCHRIAYLPQEPYLFAMSAAENIALGKSGATADEIIAAAKQAEIHAFIMGLPQGYETMLGSGGQRLSGGQKQRIAIARAFLQNADLILLDEAFTGLDAENARVVAEALRSLAAGKTMITITHHPAMAAQADRIVVIAYGAAIESGTHEALLKKRGRYAALWQTGGASGDVEED